MTDQKWGVGNAASAPAFDKIKLHGTEYELIHGEHPHSRRDNTTYARSPSGQIEEFDGHRICWKVEVEESNYLKESELSGDEIRKGGAYRLFVDGECIYEGFCRTVHAGIDAAKRKMADLEDTAGGNWLRTADREKLVGRKIFYNNIPAIISAIIVEQGCVIIKPDFGYELVPPAWEDDPEDWVAEHSDGVKDDVTSAHIWWWRE